MSKQHNEHISEGALERLVYIVGSPRGGTSLSLASFAIHEEVLALPHMTYFMDFIYRYRNKVHEKLFRKILTIPYFYNPRDVLNDLDPPMYRDISRRMNTAIKDKDMKEVWKLYPLFYSLDRHNKKPVRNIKCWVDKAKYYRLDVVAQLFPESKFVFIVRDPRSTVSSLRRKSEEISQGNNDTNDQKLVQACFSWRKTMQSILRFMRKNPDRCLCVRYEDLVQAPGKIMNRIFDFIGVKELEEEEVEKRLEDIAYFESVKSGERKRGLRAEPIERWKTQLSEEEASYIELFTCKTARMFGYKIEQRKDYWKLLKRIVKLGSYKLKVVYVIKMVAQEIRETYYNSGISKSTLYGYREQI